MTAYEIILIIVVSVVSIIALLNFLHIYLQSKIKLLNIQLEIVQTNERCLALFNQWKEDNKNNRGENGKR
jgi:hypothetical protein